MSKFKILVCCHKEVPVIRDSLFAPILLGSHYAPNEVKEYFKNDFWDSSDDNIAYLHPYCAELTAIYWAWKNYEKLGNPDYVGLFHYRRFLNFGYRVLESDPWKCAFFDFNLETRKRYGWTESDIGKVCEGYDLVLPETEAILDPKDWATPATLETHYKHAHYSEDFDKAVDVINELYPDYTESIARTKELKNAHFCNMFIMKKELFFEYAEWLFNIILQLQKVLPLNSEKYSGSNSSQRRVLGFLGERLFNVWIQKKKLDQKIKVITTQRLMGYLDKKEQDLYKKRYGVVEYARANDRVKFYDRLDQHFQSISPELSVYPNKIGFKPLVSILVPVYNVAPFLKDCVESLLNQTLKKIEFIFVDNGSTDTSFEILKDYYAKDPRITLIQHTSNQGLAISRNTALHYASGKYLAYVDSDDVCDQAMFEKLYRKAESLCADIVTCGVTAFVDQLSNSYLHRPLWWYSNSDQLLSLEERPQLLMEPAAWCKLFRTEYIRGIKHFQFRPKVLAWEDVPVMTLAFLQTNRIATVQEALYKYRIRSVGNLSNNMTERHIDEFISGSEYQSDILKIFGLSKNSTLYSYIEEFKFEYARWMLSKLQNKAIPVFFDRVGCLFDETDKNCLSRIFDYNPKARIFYRLLKMRSATLYSLAKTTNKILNMTRRGYKKLFHLGLEDSYHTIGLGSFYIKYISKSDLFNLIKWLHNGLDWVKNDLLTKIEWLHSQLKNNNDVFLKFKRSVVNILSSMRLRIRQLNCRINVLDGKIKEINEDYSTHTKKKLIELEDRVLEFENRQRQLLEKNNQLVENLEESIRSIEGKICNSKKKEDETRKIREQLEDMKREFQGFYHAVWTTGWVDVWKKFYLEKYSQIDEKKIRLKKGLDNESCELIEKICYRNFELLPKQSDSDLFRYDHAHIYTPEELKGAAIKLNIEKIKQQFVIPSSVSNFEVPVFKFHCGLTLLPEAVTRTIHSKDVIDGGAYWGDSALVINGYHPRKIYAFEPQPDNFKQLKDTMCLNNMADRVITIEAGLGNKQESTLLYSNELKSASNLSKVNAIKGPQMTSNKVKLLTIDDYVRENNLEVGLIKLDIEGNELAAVQGALETIKRYRPVLSIAIYHRPEDFFEIKPLIEDLQLDYQFMVRKIVYHDLVTEVMLLGYVLTTENKK
ncbi:FkbM family methyltransferase [Parasutterella secunda]|uniref:FkbM family methyltransferase n=1 Tax=Parasutterella secunda TaxID=626947 RepID=A0ABS2GT05_9BURK|nr:FkbM family methyltransferase [Parasutterella secunda]MBM6928980.1 FkbM family methyltransferase [Parasutterella secunda]